MPRSTPGKIIRDEGGAAAIEYALVVVLIAMALIVALTAAGVSLETVFNSVAGALPFSGS